jgi:hypothetical protein
MNQNNIPDSDGFKLWQTRKRFDTVSTAHSDSHDQKRNRDWQRYQGIHYYKSPCSRICKISLYFTSVVANISTATFSQPNPGGPGFTENSSAYTAGLCQYKHRAYAFAIY